MTEYMQVLTTVASTEEAERLGRSITGARLAACVQIVGPIRSLFWWQDKLDDAQEWLLLIKTTTERLDELERTYQGEPQLRYAGDYRYADSLGQRRVPGLDQRGDAAN